MKRQQDIERILEEFKGVRNIPGKNKERQRRMHHISERNCRCFLENSTNDFTRTKREMTPNMKRVMTEEYLKSRQKSYKAQSANSKKGKSPDSNGIRAEDIKSCDDETREMMRQLFNEIIKRNNFTPDEWKKVRIKVIHKKGDVENVSNYRPICSLPAMYKLFSAILYGRLYPMLDQKQAEDQVGFRKTYQTTDHLATYRLIERKCHEWGINMWTATVDSMKAFDSISLKSIWEALESCNVDHEYVSLLRKIYRDQKASVQTDQGDPMSGLLFNTVLQYSLKRRNTTMAKEKRNGNILERPRP